jgi:hypothetical protein
MTLTARERQLIERLIQSKKELDAMPLGTKQFNEKTAEVIDLTKQVNAFLNDRGISNEKPSPNRLFFRAFRTVFAFFAMLSIISISITSDIEISSLFNRILLAATALTYLTYFFGYIYPESKKAGY